MNVYKVFELSTNNTTYFKKITVMCKHYNWNYNTFKTRKSNDGLPMVKKVDGNYFIITQIEVK